MLKVSRQTDYAARIVLHLAQLGGGMTTIARMVQVNHLPASFVRRLVVQLEKGGLVVTLRGRKGGSGSPGRPHRFPCWMWSR